MENNKLEAASILTKLASVTGSPGRKRDL